MKQFKIFISSVQKEFSNERKELKQFIQGDKLFNRFFEVFLFEDLEALSKPAEPTYLKKASESNVFILLIGNEYGNVGPDGISPVEKEFSQAVSRKLHILAYVKGVDVSARDARVVNFINKLKDPQNGFIYKSFSNIDELKVSVQNSLFEFLIEKGVIRDSPFDLSICEGAKYFNIDEELVMDFLKSRAIKQKVGIPKISARDFLLKTIKVIREEDGISKPTNAAILFFSNNPQESIPQSSIKMARFRGNTRIEFLDSTEIFGSIYKMIDEVEIFFKRNTRLANKIVEFKRVDIPEYPFEAIREAVVNALAHRDYLREGANVQIDIFDDRIEVTSPGGLLPGLNIKKLEGSHETRNKKICEIFHETKDMERFGTGIGKMKNYMKSHGLQPPVFSEPGDFFRVTFYGPGDKILDLVPSIPEERQTDLKKLGLNERQIEALRMMVNEGKKFTINDYCRTLNVNEKTARRDFKKLISVDFVEKIGVTKNAYFKAK